MYWYFGMFLELSPDFGTNKCDNIFSAHLNTLEMFNSQRRMQFHRDDFPITVFDYILSFQYLQFRYLKCSPHSMVLKSMHVIVVICHNAIRYIFTIFPHKFICYLWGVRRSNNMSFVNELWPQNHLQEFVVCGLGININKYDNFDQISLSPCNICAFALCVHVHVCVCLLVCVRTMWTYVPIHPPTIVPYVGICMHSVLFRFFFFNSVLAVGVMFIFIVLFYQFSIQFQLRFPFAHFHFHWHTISRFTSAITAVVFICVLHTIVQFSIDYTRSFNRFLVAVHLNHHKLSTLFTDMIRVVRLWRCVYVLTVFL